ncbi:MAG: ABC transporter substrate-binding protein [Rhodospirillaceae bacterium]|nr:ABC transporter substrate-binding protein [Rhodospirillaceae bacterium]
MTKLSHVAIAAAAAVTFVAGTAMAGNAPGVTDTEIRIGNTNPYSGPASVYGTIGKSLGACWDWVNDTGGINGRKIKWISLDDGYSPPKTKEQIRKLVEREKVAFTFQTLGTPTNSAVHRYMNKKKVPHLFVATGATKWGQPKKFPWTIGWQPNYQTVGAIFGNYILQNYPNGKVAVMYQNDDYGKDYVIGMKRAMGDKYAMQVVKEETYEVTDPTIDSQIVSLKNSGADVFVNISIPKFAAQAIKKMYAIKWKPAHLLNDVAASISSTYKPAGIEKAKGIISVDFYKDPHDPEWKDDPETNAWRAWMDKYYPGGDKANKMNAYGYAVCHTMIEVLKNAGNDLSRENIMKQAASLHKVMIPMLLPGMYADTSPTDFYPVEQMQMTRFDGTRSVRFGPLISAETE